MTAAEFAAAMARLGPWDAARRVAVAVSGGPDSLALALLAQGWGCPAAFIVDHGLRAGSGQEAATARDVLSARGIPAAILCLAGLLPGPGVASRARDARYAALAAACRAAGLVDLLLGHHAGDQAETVLMRQRRSSGPAGLAGMAALVEGDDVRLVRPLLAIDPARLRATVDAAGLVPAEDPTNTDLRTTRARLRIEIGEQRAALLAIATVAGAARAVSEGALAAELAARVTLYPAGYAVLSPGPVSAAALAALVRTIGGRRYAVSHLAALAAAPRSATVGGVRLLPAGRHGPGWLLVRERAAAAVPATPGTVWDGRFRVARAPAGAWIGAAGRDAAWLRHRPGPPAAALAPSPVLRVGGTVVWAPHANNHSSMPFGHDTLVINAAPPIAGAAFLACS